LLTTSGEIAGTGFYISQQGHLLTCAHVSQKAGGWEHIRVRGQEVTPTYSGDPTFDDIAVLQTAAYEGDHAKLGLQYQPFDRFLTTTFAQSDISSGLSIDGTIADTSVQVSSSSLRMLRLKMRAHFPCNEGGGFSGAPVFHAESQTVVALIATYDESQGALAVPIAAVLNKWGPLKNFLTPAMTRANDHGICTARVFISYRSEDPDLSLAQLLYEAIKKAGHTPFMAGESLRLGDDWPSRINSELEQADYFLILLSPRSASSDMVTEEVRRAKQLHDLRTDRRPRFLPIRVKLPWSEPLNYDLAGYLSRFQQRRWDSDADTTPILTEVLDLLNENREPLDSTSPVAGPSIQGPDQPPVPTAPPELPEGQVAIASAFYMPRPPIEVNCFQEIEKPGALIHIRAPRQMGKTSLMARILNHARETHLRTATVSFQLTSDSIFSNLHDLLRWFCAIVGKKLGIPPALDTQWTDLLDDKSNCTAYLEDYLLPLLTGPVVLGLDEVDRVLDFPKVANEFLGLLRGWHELAKDQEIWQKLRLVVVHSTESYVNLDVNQSPFNVGLPVKLEGFNSKQVGILAHQHGLSLSDDDISALMDLVSGHPYLVRVALYYVARHEISYSGFLATAATEAGKYSDHLRRHLWILQQHPTLSKSMSSLIQSRGPALIDSENGFKLESMGLIKRTGNDAVTISCALYERYFSSRLVALRAP